jgi:hypothetical protein
LRLIWIRTSEVSERGVSRLLYTECFQEQDA